MHKDEFEVGMRIFYGGDMANREGFGTITEIIDRPVVGPRIRIAMDDGREKDVSPVLFSREYKGHGGTKFVLEQEYHRWRDEKFKRMQQE